MKLNSTDFENLYVVDTFIHKDSRGLFGKVFSEKDFSSKKVNTKFMELFYSFSGKNVIRGMHFQIPPYDHEKLVFVIQGSIIDVVVDIRKNSKKFSEYFEIELSGLNQRALYIPKGFAHGFKSLEKASIVCYLTTSIYSKEHDKGILYNSFGYNWKCENPILSERDKSFIELEEYDLPFLTEDKYEF